MYALAVKILIERNNNNNVDKNKLFWTYHFTKFTVAVPGTRNFHVILIFSETTSFYLI